MCLGLEHTGVSLIVSSIFRPMTSSLGFASFSSFDVPRTSKKASLSFHKIEICYADGKYWSKPGLEPESLWTNSEPTQTGGSALPFCHSDPSRSQVWTYIYPSNSSFFPTLFLTCYDLMCSNIWLAIVYIYFDLNSDRISKVKYRLAWG